MESEILNHYQKGSTAFEERRYDEAYTSFSILIGKGHKFADVFNMMGFISYMRGDYLSAKDYFKQALEINPNYTEASLNLAVTMNDTGEYINGENAFLKAKNSAFGQGGTFDPYAKGRVANLHFELAELYHGLGYYEDSLREYRAAVKLRSGFPDVRTKMGVLMRDLGQHDEATREFNKVLEAHPGYLPAYIQLGITHYGQGETKEAVEAWNKVVERDPSNEMAAKYINLAESGVR